jgi:hypothetical protein
MAPVEVACGQIHLETRPLSFTKVDKDRIVQNFPEKITVLVPGFGAQELPLRPYIKSILDQVQPPAVKIAIAVRGEPDDLDTLEIDDVLFKVVGTTAGSFKVGDVAIAYTFDADILPGEMTVEACTCEDGGEGQRRSRTFTCTWDIEISIDPGIAGVYEVEEFEIAVISSCIGPDRTFEIEEADAGLFDPDHDDDADVEHDEDDDESEDDETKDDDARESKKKKSGKKKAKGRGK